jgi:tripartite-type tricarboxylate transporter receptor subunit TctC
MKTRDFLLVLLTLVLIIGVAGIGYVQAADPAYPTKQVELIQTAAPGGGQDAVSRAVAEYVTKKWGQPVVVVNKPGGATVVGAHYALKEAKPDGYTIFAEAQIPSSMMVAGMLNPPIKLEDRIFIARVVLDPVCFAVNADAPWKTFKELSDWAKVHAKELTWGSTGPFGTSAFGVGEWLVSLGVNPLDTRMVVSSGFAETIPRLLGGHIMVACQTVAEFYPLVKAGKVRALAVVSEKRNPHLPELPTATEAGVAGLKGVNWWSGLSVRPGTPQYVIDKWAKVAEEMIKDPTFLEKMNNLHVTVSYVSLNDFRDAVYKEAETYTKLAPMLGVRK